MKRKIVKIKRIQNPTYNSPTKIFDDFRFHKRAVCCRTLNYFNLTTYIYIENFINFLHNIDCIENGKKSGKPKNGGFSKKGKYLHYAIEWISFLK